MAVRGFAEWWRADGGVADPAAHGAAERSGAGSLAAGCAGEAAVVAGLTTGRTAA